MHKLNDLCREIGVSAERLLAERDLAVVQPGAALVVSDAALEAWLATLPRVEPRSVRSRAITAASAVRAEQTERARALARDAIVAYVRGRTAEGRGTSAAELERHARATLAGVGRRTVVAALRALDEEGVIVRHVDGWWTTREPR